MLKKYWPQLVSIFAILAIIIIVNVLAVFGYVLVASGFQLDASKFFTTLSNIVFLEGGIILTFGAFIEFFVRSRSAAIARSMLRPYSWISKRNALSRSEADAAKEEEYRSGGWMLIFLGAVAIVFSIIFALIISK